MFLDIQLLEDKEQFPVKRAQVSVFNRYIDPVSFFYVLEMIRIRYSIAAGARKDRQSQVVY
jgi:hypothetical protein